MPYYRVVIDVILTEALLGTPHIPSLSLTRDGNGATSLSTRPVFPVRYGGAPPSPVRTSFPPSPPRVVAV